MTMLADDVDVVIGVDTHKDSHTAAVVEAATGAPLETRQVSTEPKGYAELVSMAESRPGRRVWAVEGTGGYGAGLTRILVERGEWVIELDRPNRPARRNGAKSDPLDAVRAAREALARQHHAIPRASGQRARLSVLLAARRSAVESATVAQRQLQSLIIAAPERLRARFRGQGGRRMLALAANLRLDHRWDPETRSYAEVLRSLARRSSTLEAEARRHKTAIGEIVKTWRPDLLEVFGVGPITAATILCAWSDPTRFRSEAAFANLAGAAPIPASSGKTIRHRLNRCGDRQLNNALHVIALHRLRHDPTTKAYLQRRRAEGKTDREIRRCIKRYIARQLYRQLQQPLDDL